jgi:predicted DNA-binding transcriptional regulator AlpA
LPVHAGYRRRLADIGTLTEKDMKAFDIDDIKARLASHKLETGAMLSLDEVATTLSVSHSTIHRLPLPSYRIGRSLRYDPRDVRQLLDRCREPIAA